MHSKLKQLALGEVCFIHTVILRDSKRNKMVEAVY